MKTTTTTWRLVDAAWLTWMFPRTLFLTNSEKQNYFHVNGILYNLKQKLFQNHFNLNKKERTFKKIFKVDFFEIFIKKTNVFELHF